MRQKKMNTQEEWLMVKEVAKLLDRSGEAVRQYERSGKLKSTKTANGWRLFRRSDVMKLAAELGVK